MSNLIVLILLVLEMILKSAHLPKSGIQTLDMMSCINRFLYELQNGGAMMSDSFTNSKAGWPRYFIHDQYKADARGRNTNLIGGTFMTISEVKNFFHFSYSS